MAARNGNGTAYLHRLTPMGAATGQQRSIRSDARSRRPIAAALSSTGSSTAASGRLKNSRRKHLMTFAVSPLHPAGGTAHSACAPATAIISRSRHRRRCVTSNATSRTAKQCARVPRHISTTRTLATKTRKPWYPPSPANAMRNCQRHFSIVSRERRSPRNAAVDRPRTFRSSLEIRPRTGRPSTPRRRALCRLRAA